MLNEIAVFVGTHTHTESLNPKVGFLGKCMVYLLPEISCSLPKIELRGLGGSKVYIEALSTHCLHFVADKCGKNANGACRRILLGLRHRAKTLGPLSGYLR